MDISDSPPITETRTTCPYCGVGCGVLVQTERLPGEGVSPAASAGIAGRRVIGIRGDPDHPANHGRLCTKGSTLHLTASPTVQRQTRVARPQLRRERTAPRQDSDWDTTLEHLVDRFEQTIRAHGPDAVAFYLSGQLLTEDYYVFNKLAKGLIGTNNVDTNSRLCMSSAVAGYKRTLGADAPPACYEDIDHCSLLFIAGSNTAYAHPILFRRIEEARARNPGLKIVVVDPRRTDTAASADLHLAIQPGTDVALFNAMLHMMIWEDWIDRAWIRAHAEGFEAIRTSVATCTPTWASEICGVRAQDIVTAARWFAQSGASLSLYCQGLNQSAHGTDKNVALIHLHLATGQIGRPGTGPFSLTGQPNAMGGREVGGMANLLSAHRDLANPEHREEVARLWGVREVPSQPGKTAVEMFDAIAAGTIRIVWIVCTNPAHSMPEVARVHAALRKAELVVVQEAFHTTATVDFADVLLPATTFAEKDGTVTNSERCISRVLPAVAPYEDARHDWAIAVDFARRLQRRLADRLDADCPDLFDFPDAESIWNEHRESTRGRDLDITGMSYRMLRDAGPQQWPLPEGATRGRTRLYEDGVFATPDGRARFLDVAYRPVAEAIDARFPWRLTTGRLRDQWHGMSRTGLVPQLFSHAPEPVIEMNADEAMRRGFHDGQLVRVSSRRGSQVLPVAFSESLRGSTTFIAMHWGPEFLAGHPGDHGATGVNGLTHPGIDPHSKQPELKHAAVRIEPAGLPHRMVVAGWLDADVVMTRREALRRQLGRLPGDQPGHPHGACEFASCLPFGHAQTGLVLQLGSREPFDEALIQTVLHAFDVADAPMARYDDGRRASSRRLMLRNGRIRFMLVAGDLRSGRWLLEMLQTSAPVEVPATMLLMAGEQAPASFVSRGPIVCNCFAVAQRSIESAIARHGPAGADCLKLVQHELSCGTNCGSCLPELRRMIDAAARNRTQAAGTVATLDQRP